MVDVLLATELTRIAWAREAQHISLVAGDSDFVAAVQAARNAGAVVRLYYYRHGNTTYGDRLFDEVDERFDLADILSAMKDKKPDHRRAHRKEVESNSPPSSVKAEGVDPSGPAGDD